MCFNSLCGKLQCLTCYRVAAKILDGHWPTGRSEVVFAEDVTSLALNSTIIRGVAVWPKNEDHFCFYFCFCVYIQPFLSGQSGHFLLETLVYWYATIYRSIYKSNLWW